MTVMLTEWVDRYLPRQISDTFRDAESIAAWMRSLPGLTYAGAQPVRLNDGNQRAIGGGIAVCRNGYVFRA